MTRIALIVTGELERLGLATSLQRSFPEAEFVVDMKLESFTSARVRRLHTSMPGRLIDKVAAALVAAVDPGRSRKGADYAIAVEDLEICNLDQPDFVVSEFRDAVFRHVNQVWPSSARRDRAFTRLRERASFHLLSPMLEAYFFGDADVLATVGVAASPHLAPGIDLEDFTVADPRYLETAQGAASWAVPDRARHPKHYLQYLLDPTSPPVQRYRETQQGVAALARLDWAKLVARLSGHVRLARSLLVDIADSVGRDARGLGDAPHPATALRGDGMLRNA